jgi:hypothetical protein
VEDGVIDKPYEQAPREWLIEHTKQADEAHDLLSALAVPECVHNGEHNCDSLADRIQWLAEGGGETLQELARMRAVVGDIVDAGRDPERRAHLSLSGICHQLATALEGRRE